MSPRRRKETWVLAYLRTPQSGPATNTPDLRDGAEALISLYNCIHLQTIYAVHIHS
jgi:hypothetical protein